MFVYHGSKLYYPSTTLVDVSGETAVIKEPGNTDKTVIKEKAQIKIN